MWFWKCIICNENDNVTVMYVSYYVLWSDIKVTLCVYTLKSVEYSYVSEMFAFTICNAWNSGFVNYRPRKHNSVSVYPTNNKSQSTTINESDLPIASFRLFITWLWWVFKTNADICDVCTLDLFSINLDWISQLKCFWVGQRRNLLRGEFWGNATFFPKSPTCIGYFTESISFAFEIILSNIFCYFDFEFHFSCKQECEAVNHPPKLLVYSIHHSTLHDDAHFLSRLL